jgi:phosphocarrier protein FPr
LSPQTFPSPVSRELIRLDARAQDKTDAIAQVAQMLVAAGCVAPGYEASMGRRAKRWRTPSSAMAWQSRTGLARTAIWCAAMALPCCSCRKAWNGIRAGHPSGGWHRRPVRYPHHLLRRLTRLIQDEATLQRLFTTTDAGEIVNADQRHCHVRPGTGHRSGRAL